ncbi:MAG: carbohydrate kinase family protein [Aureliella sp.]
MNKLKIISLGEVLWDLYPDGELFGGAPANFACHAALQGADVEMVSAVGNDDRGRLAITVLRDYGIDVSRVQRIPNVPTGTVGVELDAEGKPTYVIHPETAWDALEWDSEMVEAIHAADAVCFGTLGQRSDPSRRTIRRAIMSAADAGVMRVLDINLRPPYFDRELICDSIRLASILKLSDDELCEVCFACGIDDSRKIESVRSLREIGDLDMVLMTRGADGAVLVTAEDTIEQPGVSANVVDTVGAGDAFTASFLIGLLKSEPHTESLRNACEVAAATCAYGGAVPPPRSIESRH